MVAAASILLLSAPVTAAYAPILVKDICSGVTLSSSPSDITAVGHRVVFSATRDYIRGIWSSDGTDAGTTLLAELADNYRFLSVLNGRLLYAVGRDSTTLDLWSTDSHSVAAVATVHVESNTAIRASAAAAGRVFFLIDEPKAGWGLWATDGTAAGTMRIMTVTSGVNRPNLVFMVAAENAVYFPGSDAEHGVELWKSDGTPEGTAMVTDINPGGGDSNPISWSGGSVGNTLYFSALDANGPTLWRTDGTTAGTCRILALPGVPSQFYPEVHGVVNGKVLFSASNNLVSSITGLWETDGTPEGTALIARECPPGGVLGIVNNALIFIAPGTFRHPQLWRSDGTVEGTLAIQGVPADVYLSSYATVIAGGQLFLDASFAGLPATLWVTDGTAAGTHEVLAADSTFYSPIPGALAGDVVYLSASDRVHGNELWRSQGTASSTWQVADVNDATDSASPHDFANAGGLLYFAAYDCLAGQWGVWRSDGTEAGTFALRIPLTLQPALWDLKRAFLPVGRNVFFIAQVADTPPMMIFFSDGTPQGTRVFLDPQILPKDATPTELAWMDGSLYALVNYGGGGGFWRTDGTPGGTSLLASFSPSDYYREPKFLVTAGKRLFFVADDGAGSALWTSDGTSEGTIVLGAPESGFEIDGFSNRFAVIGDQAYFAAADPVHHEQVWRSDGTLEGTAPLKDVFPPDQSVNGLSIGISAVNGRLFFIGTDGSHGWEPWTSDGTADGTYMLQDIWPGPSSSVIGLTSWFLPAPRQVWYFAAADPNHGWALRLTDGTPENTRLVVDLAQPPFEMHLFDGAPVGDRFLFSWSLDIDGYDFPATLWITDGTEEGTWELTGVRMLYDIMLMPALMTPSNNCVFFEGSDLHHGNELWKVCGPPKPRRRLQRTQ